MKKDYGSENTLNLKFVIAVTRFANELKRETALDFSSYQLTEPQFGVLEALYHKGELTVNQVIEKTLSSSGNMGVVIDNLIKKGLIEKKMSPSDKRSRILFITDRGRAMIDELFPEHLKTLNKILNPLSDEEKQTVIQIFKAYSQNRERL